jgi:hypothetical protein
MKMHRHTNENSEYRPVMTVVPFFVDSMQIECNVLAFIRPLVFPWSWLTKVQRHRSLPGAAGKYALEHRGAFRECSSPINSVPSDVSEAAMNSRHVDKDMCKALFGIENQAGSRRSSSLCD